MAAHYEPSAHKFISYDAAFRVATEVANRADEQGVRSALCGGAAMGYYGSDRLTKDVDFVADGFLSDDQPVSHLSFGGERYLVGDVPVDWIRRSDDDKLLYDRALDERASTSGFGPNLFILQPEYLVLMKIAAGRSKDHQDVVFLLRRRGLVDRDRLKSLARSIYGRGAASSPTIHDIDSFSFEADRSDFLDSKKPDA